MFHDDVESIFNGFQIALDNFINDKYTLDSISPKEQAIKKFELIKDGKNINIMLLYGDELYELGNWLKQLFAESL